MMEENKLNIGIVILSRYNSSRLPGKALRIINGKEVLTYIVERICQVIPRSQIVVATSDQESDLPIVNYCKHNDIQVYRGSLDNVALRFYEACKHFDMDYVVRINGDNIFLDVEVFAKMISITKSNNHDFISNVKNRTFPKGMSIEIIKADFYKKLMPDILTDSKYYEHVTSYIYLNEPEANYCYVYNDSIPESAGIQMALDTIEDFERSKFIISKFKTNHWNYNLMEIFEIYKTYESA